MKTHGTKKRFGVRLICSARVTSMLYFLLPMLPEVVRVERRMAPLSHDVAGVILPHDTFGTNLDSKADTIDKDLEI